MVEQSLDTEVDLNTVQNIVRGLSYPADRLREIAEGAEILEQREHPLGHAALLTEIWGERRTAIRARFTLPDEVVSSIDAFVEKVHAMDTSWRTGADVDDFEGTDWSWIRATGQAILLRTPNMRDARNRTGEVMPTIPATEAGLRRLLDVLDGTVRLDVALDQDPRDHDTDLSSAVAKLGTAFPDTFVEEVRRRDLVDDRTLTWGIHLMGDLPSALAPLLVEGFLEASSRNRSAWLGLLVDYPQHAARDDLVRTLVDPSESVRAQAAIALRRIGDPSVADALEGSISARPPEDPQLLGTMQRALAALRRR